MSFHHEYAIIVLEGYDTNAINWPQDHSNSMEAIKFEGKKNPNDEIKRTV